MRAQLLAGATIHTVGGIDLTELEQTHLDKITKIQAGVRGHLARKHLGAPRPPMPVPEAVCPSPGRGLPRRWHQCGCPAN